MMMMIMIGGKSMFTYHQWILGVLTVVHGHQVSFYINT